MQQRFSPKIDNIASEKRPYHGDDQKKLLDTSTDQGRRVSPRLRNIPNCKKPYYGSGKKKLLEAPKGNSRKKNIKLDHSIQVCQVNMAREFAEDESCSSYMDMDSVPIDNSANSEDDHLKWAGCSNSLVDRLGKNTFLKVKETLRLLNLHCLRIAEEEKKRCRKLEISDLQIVNGSKCKMLKEIEIFDPDKKFGQPPGIEVGHQFFSLAEMLAVGFSGHWLGGVDHMKNTCSKSDDYHGYTFPLAVTILLSSQHEDDVDNSEVVCNCPGGNDLLGNKTQDNDQAMDLGNMALKHNVDYSVPVRVIRGQECADAYNGKVYIYDGLYKVMNCSAATNISGYTVFKYSLKRLKGQLKFMSKNQDHFIRGKVSKDYYQSAGLVCIDISNGQEDICIPATNVIDNPPISPSDAPGCNCKGSCISARTCSCALLNGFDFPYVRQNGGRLIEPKDVVFECGPRCACGPGCVNRTTQQGLRYRLEVYRTEDKGWAVRSWDFIPSGAPVCEYTGVLRRSDELDNVSENDFIFEIDCWQTMNEIGGREKRLRNVSVPTSNLVEKKNDKVPENAPEFCIDAGLYGNVARFVNHSCEPNLFVQCVLSSHHDIRLARVVLFAADDIPPMQELTYDYGYKLDSVIGPDGKIKQMPCNCGTADCRKRLY
ncbi:Histone-lysine N-methyltransferase H3 lysine-9 specific SUVH4 [Melia azedarach]|uniref:Histone-lysine N-methyltransferase H3 lysine-9 specific SUVH4 n=1 Tax=Melia azedarach TaxID=155640 RepID=A0ACC1YA76_MELAZ|nr:Histone-lysine N-methyltransferase H3 lysine-9 specific SUVH4 [Melia azedarach]